ncbi:hypothetical protein CRG98_047120 [Punica granatum]|uniref:Uncharacterized protein n=1 Tax=Punica granatum TaxID=22663 RepID=A0A2I0HMH4_PUNGR|nr:hypothetical protein CRG98_047120 [Punica granatum]
MGCSSLGYLFHASVAKALVQLVELEVKDSSLEVIVAEDKGVPPASTLEFVFPRATKLELSDLPQLKSFYPGKYISRWPSLRELMIFKSNKVEIFAFDSKKSRAITRTGNQAEQPLFLVDKVHASYATLSPLDYENYGHILDSQNRNNEIFLATYDECEVGIMNDEASIG